MVGPVVDVDWVAQYRDEVVLADVRWYLDGRPGRAAQPRGASRPGVGYGPKPLDEMTTRDVVHSRRPVLRSKT